MFILFLLLSIPAGLLVFGAGYVAAIVWHAETLVHGREVTQEFEDAPGDAWTVTDGLLTAGLKLAR